MYNWYIYNNGTSFINVSCYHFKHLFLRNVQHFFSVFQLAFIMIYGKKIIILCRLLSIMISAIVWIHISSSHLKPIWNLITSVRVLAGYTLGRWLTYEGWTLINEIMVLSKTPLPSPPLENTEIRHWLWTKNDPDLTSDVLVLIIMLMIYRNKKRNLYIW